MPCPERVEHVLHGVSNSTQCPEADRRRPALEGVSSAEDLSKAFGIGGVGLQAEQPRLDRLDSLLGLRQEDLSERLVVDAHEASLGTRNSSAALAGKRDVGDCTLRRQVPQTRRDAMGAPTRARLGRQVLDFPGSLTSDGRETSLREPGLRAAAFTRCGVSGGADGTGTVRG